MPAQCTSGQDYCPGGQYATGYTDPTLCDGAPVYQKGGGGDGDAPVLYRQYYADEVTTWVVSPGSTALTTCAGPGIFSSYIPRATPYAPRSDSAPTAPAYNPWHQGPSGGISRPITVTAGGG